MADIMVDGLQELVMIRRDGYGIPHVQARDERDAWFGMGFAAAEDRLWQMEYDRRRAVGRWSEVVGPSGLTADVLARRLRLEEAAKRDVAAMTPQTRDAFAAYAAGVNAFLASGRNLPPEYGLARIDPETWEPWQSVASFKIRHVLMGAWQTKLAQAILLARIGPERFARLESRPPRGSVVAVPPGSRIQRLYERAGQELAEAARELGFLAEVEAGSNAWAVSGARTTTGRPMLCNDSHRALDVPNVYWQIHLTCPAFDVIGATFPGLPGFPHFGHNGQVAWAITHAGADYQDLYIELFDGDRVRTPDGWEMAGRHAQVIQVRGEQPREIETWTTRHGPVIHGDPRSGRALSLRYTATDRPCRGFEVLRPMLAAQDVEDLLASQRDWVDPVNNVVAADVHGNIAYLTRGMLPIRSSTAHQQLPAPGWTGEHEWVGIVPFEQMPRTVNPPEGFIVTANQAIVDAQDIYISYTFADPFRAERIVERISQQRVATLEQLASMQGDTESIAARWWGRLAAELEPLQGGAERARRLLADWDANLLPSSPAALLYACFRRAVVRALFEPIVGPETWEWLASARIPPTTVMIRRWLADRLWRAANDREPQAVAELRNAMRGALDEAWRTAAALAGPSPTRWHWAEHHHTNAQHTLVAGCPDLAGLLSPPQVGIGGDSDTIQAASYDFQQSSTFTITGLSVYRQVVDLSDIAHATYVIPGGASGNPNSPHYVDQLALWQVHAGVPMHYLPHDIETATLGTLTLSAEHETAATSQALFGNDLTILEGES
jgi:penicillin G amidase